MDSGSYKEGGGASSPLLWKKEEEEEVMVMEAKEQVGLAVPMIVTNAAYYFIPLISVMFAGHLGQLHLAASNLANSWAAVIGFSLLGAPLAASISLWISVLMLGCYLLKARRFEETWNGFSLECFSYLFANLKIALPSAAMVCLEHWAFEILVLLGGLMPNSEITTSLIAMCVNTEAIAYMTAYGLSAAASTRVSNELGAGRPGRARHAMSVSLILTVGLAAVVVLALGLGHNIWASSFSSSPVIIDAFASMTPFLVVSISCDFVQGILSGVARGCGWQHLVVFINLGTYYFIGMLLAALLAFKTTLQAKGLWIGLICGLASQTIGLSLLSYFTKWKRIELSHDSSSTIVA